MTLGQAASCLLWWAWVAGIVAAQATSTEVVAERKSPYAEIRVVDAQTGRGLPLVELETVNSLQMVTDNAGRVAWQEPGLMGREIFFAVRSHGYDVPRDGLGISGVKVTPEVGKPVKIRLERKMRAERWCRLTGEGLYRDSLLLGYPFPLRLSAHPGLVAGQDSVQTAIYGGRIYWFWGDTQRMSYPLGLFRTAGATTPMPDDQGRLEGLEHGISFDYFVDPSTGFARAMMPLTERPEGVVWISGVCVVPDRQGVKHMVAHYTRRQSLAVELEQGIAVWNDEGARFEPVLQLPLDETWRRPAGHPIEYDADGQKWLLMGSPNPNVRVRAELEFVVDPQQYEAWTCRAVPASGDADGPSRREDGSIDWRWQKQLPPVDSQQEAKWLADEKLRSDECRFLPADAEQPKDRVTLHNGSVRWNAYRQRWLLVAGQVFGRASMLGEVWCGESESPTGPFHQVTRVVTHDRQSFYNVCHHGFLDQQGGRVIYFEGTYTQEFSGNPARTPRYNYNQILYRLDLESVFGPSSDRHSDTRSDTRSTK